jgi:PhzF family phenazine biosynthesis protein
MASHPFRIVNVFTREGDPLSGNPLCVFENAADFDTETMQALARQFNLSETTFVLPSKMAAARVRIFTPEYEMPFAGHPTLGTAHVCRSLGLGGNALQLETQAGVIPVDARGNRWTLTAPAVTWRELSSPVSVLAEALGLQRDDICERPLWVKAGREQLIVPLLSQDAVRRAVPQTAALRALGNGEAVMAYVFAASGRDRTMARFFFPQGALMLEDPATGSATANFGGWCLAMRQPLPIHLEISQGDLIGRPATLYLDVAIDRQIRVGGDVADIAAGRLTLR